MAGRRRKQGKREPNGRVQRNWRPDLGTPEAAFHKQVAVGSADPVLSATAVGVLHARLPGLVSRAMMDAGLAYAWLRYASFGRPFPKTSRYAECIHDHLTSEYSALPLTTDEDVRRRYIAADKVLLGVARKCRDETYNVCVEDRLPGWFQRRRGLVVRKSDFANEWALTTGLEVLKEHFGIED